MLIGKRVRELRKTQKIKLSELAEKSGVQIATLSRIEHQKMTGTLDSHMRIAKALGVEITELYSDIIREDKTIEVQTSRSENDVFVHNDKASYEILTQKVLSKKMMPVLLKLEPGGQTNKEQGPFGAEKFLYIMEGTVEIKIGKEPVTLNKNNSLYFDASLEHHFVNVGKSQAKILSVCTPATL